MQATSDISQGTTPNVDTQISITTQQCEANNPVRLRSQSQVVLVNAEGKILLQKRTDDAPTYPGYWCFFGGGFKRGETPYDTLKREAKEELNIDIERRDFDLCLSYRDEKYNRYGNRYFYVMYWEKPELLNLQEGQDWGWFYLDQAFILLMKDANYEAIEKLKPIIRDLTISIKDEAL